MADIFGGMRYIMVNWFWIVLVILLIVVLVIVIMVIRYKVIFKYPVRIFRIRENEKCIEANYKGGYRGRRGSAPFFQIKTGRFPWQHIDLNTTPNPAYFDEQNRVYYKQIDVNAFIQLRRGFGSSTIDYTPVECDVKYGAILDIHRIKNVLKTESTLSKLAPYIALILLFIAAIVGWWFVMNAKCPG